VFIDVNPDPVQVAVSIQALVLNKEPYYNEAGFERQRGHSEVRADKIVGWWPAGRGWDHISMRVAIPQASRSARAYNELTVIKSLEHLAAMAADPMPAFIKEINRHTNLNAYVSTQCALSKINAHDNTSFAARQGDHNQETQ
jgi:hypothetical protein